MSAEQERPGIGGSDISKRRWKHSENQEVRNRARHGRNKIFRGRDKAVEDVSRRHRIQQSWEEFIEIGKLTDEQRKTYEMSKLQHHILHGELTKQDLECLAQNGETTGTFTAPEGNK